MIKEKNSVLRKAQFVADIVLTAASFFMASYISEAVRPGVHDPGHTYLYLLYIILPVWALLLKYNKVYHSIRTQSVLSSLWSVTKTALMGGLFLMTSIFVFKIWGLSRAFIFIFILVNTSAFAVERLLLHAFFHHIRRRGYNYRNVLIIGTGNRAIRFFDTISSHPEWGLKISGFIDKDPGKKGRMIQGKSILGTLEEIQGILIEHHIDSVVFVGPRNWLDEVEKIIVPCETIGVQIQIACDFYPNTLSKIHFDTLGNWPLLAFMPPPHYGGFIFVKRAIDVAFSALVLFFAAPLFIFTAAGIKLTSPGPVFFRQKRCGLSGRVFELLKFRTMVNGAESIKSSIEHLNEMSGPVFKVRNDPRITPFGRFLRKFSLDEFPQFINVLKGDMSIVGPRPPIPNEVEKYDYSQRRRLSVKPGITCLWQVAGRNKIGFSDWVKLDLEYIDKWSMSLDLKIILKTIPAMLKGTGL
ncbi:MAG: sugar transferase [Deltaproteobacteria bacterium]|nr:sugar transferase [Deltaproteobacteria bacterium]